MVDCNFNDSYPLKKDKYRDEAKTQWECVGQSWMRDLQAHTHRGLSGSHGSLERAKKDNLLDSSQESLSDYNINFQLVSSRTETEYIFVMKSHLTNVIFLIIDKRKQNMFD